MVYILIIAAGVGVGIYFSKKIDENYENGYYDDLYEDELEPFDESVSGENPEDELKRLRDENEELKRYRNGDK